jgi:cullin-associated NEDD8-dissociated protein 1
MSFSAFAIVVLGIALAAAQAPEAAPEAAPGQVFGPASGPEQAPNTAFSANDAPIVAPGGWREGRATFYNAPKYFTDIYASRGQGAFGNVLYNSCGYYQQTGAEPVTAADLPYGQDFVAAASNVNLDYPGSCGRCYEVQCRNGLVIDEGTTPFKGDNGYDLQAVAPDTNDDFGRSFPGNPAKDEGLNFVQCWNDTESVFVTVVDTCPCTSETANNTAWCCSAVQHFDLAFGAFERLAHPLYGVQMLNYRPVNCYTKEPFPTLVPGFLNETIYGDRVETGWSWNVYASDFADFWLEGAGIGGSNATCIQTTSSGGVTFTARNGTAGSYQPFSEAGSLRIAARNNGTSGDTGIPVVKLTLQNTEEKLYCGGNVILGQTVQPSSTEEGGWNVFNIPITQFGCQNPSLSQVDALGVQNTGSQTIAFCLDDIALVQSSTTTAGRKMK